MSAAKSWFVKSATFKGVAITGLTGYSIDESGQMTDIATDGSKTINMSYVTNIAMDVSVETTDVSLASNASLRTGQAGALVLVLQQRAEGSGAAGGADKTATFANAVMGSPSEGVPHEGNSTQRFNWRCSDPAGVSAVVWS